MQLNKKKERLRKRGIPEEDHKYFVFTGAISNQTYAPQDKKILILTKKGKLKGLEEINTFFNSQELSRVQEKYFLCFTRNIHLT